MPVDVYRTQQSFMQSCYSIIDYNNIISKLLMLHLRNLHFDHLNYDKNTKFVKIKVETYNCHNILSVEPMCSRESKNNFTGLTAVEQRQTGSNVEFT